ncbi:MAG: hypothetical protein WCE79_13545 [Xanthobacteraceae bacterium]
MTPVLRLLLRDPEPTEKIAGQPGILAYNVAQEDDELVEAEILIRIAALHKLQHLRGERVRRQGPEIASLRFGFRMPPIDLALVVREFCPKGSVCAREANQLDELLCRYRVVSISR